MVAALKIPVLFHPPKVADFHMIAFAYPQITFMMAHLGSFSSQNWSEHLAAIDTAKRYPNVYLETSSVILWRYLEMASREIPEKLIFGSDGPDGDSRVEIHKIRLLKLPKDLGEESAGRDCPAAGSRLRSTTVFDRRATCSRSNRGSGSHALALLDDSCHLFR